MGCPPRLACECSGQGGKGFPQSQINSGDVPVRPWSPLPRAAGRLLSTPLPGDSAPQTRRRLLRLHPRGFQHFLLPPALLHFLFPSIRRGWVCCPREGPAVPATPRPVGADSPGAWPGHQRFPLSVVCFFLPSPLPLIHRLLVFLEVCIHHRHQFIFFQFY